MYLGGTMMKRIFTFLCALILLFGLVPMFGTAVAAAGDEIDFDDLLGAASIVILKQPEDAFVAVNATATTTVQAQGTNLSYTWYFNDGDGFKKSSITTNTYSAEMVAWRSGRQVYCVIGKKDDPDFPVVKTETVTLAILPSFAQQPANATAANGAQVKTTVKAVGEGVSYTWYFKNASATSWSVSKLTGDTYTATMSSATSGRQVYCVITDKYGHTAKSNTATLTMKNVAAITKQPASVAVASGATAKTTITATGDGLTYTWYYKNKDASSFTKSSTTTNTYSAVMDSTRNGRQVYCVIKDKYGNSVKSSVATLSIKTVAKITKQPANVTAVSGATAKTTITAVGDGATYTWYFKNKGASTYSKSSITTNTYSMTMDSTRAGRQVYCVVTDKYGNTVKSNTVTLSMKTVAKITKQPTNVSAVSGATAKTTVTAVGDGATYTWYYKNKTASTYTKSSITTNTYSMTMDSTRDGRQVYCVVKDKYGNSVKSNVVTLSMKTVAKITKQPANVLALSGATAKTTVTAVGDGATYTWYFKNKTASTYTKSSITSNTYSMTMDSTRNGRQVYCVVKDKYGNSVKSNVVTLSMKTVAKITKQPTSVTVANGATAKTTVTATGDGLSYTWYIKNAGATTWSKSSATGSSYSVTMKSTVKGRQVYCVIKDTYGNSVKSNVVTLNMK